MVINNPQSRHRESTTLQKELVEGRHFGIDLLDFEKLCFEHGLDPVEAVLAWAKHHNRNTANLIRFIRDQTHLQCIERTEFSCAA